MYAIAYVCSPFCFATTMLCRLFGKLDSNKFSSKWLTLIYVFIKETIIDWAQILSDNLAKAIIEYKRKRSIAFRVYPPFFMSAYIMYAICFGSKFPLMGWKWTVQGPLPMHIHHKDMWESNFKPHFFKIFHGVMLPIHKQIYNEMPPDSPKK